MNELEEELAASLRRDLDMLPVSPAAEGRILARVRRRIRRRRRLLTMALPAVLLVAGISVAVVVTGTGRVGNPRQEAAPRVAHQATDSCAGFSPSAQLTRARVVVVGIMLPGPTVHLSDRNVLLTPARMRVLRYVKGNGPASIRIDTGVTRTARGIEVNDSGIQPRVGQRWKIYTSSERMPYKTSVCDGSMTSGAAP